MQPKLLKKIRTLTVFFMIMLALSGITAFPVYSELNWLKQFSIMNNSSFISNWLNHVYYAVQDAQTRYPFLFYGYDWLAFAHLIIAALFYGVYKNPVRNKFIISWGMFCCTAVLPLAFIAGPIRGIPWQHILIDCSFGITGIIPLAFCRRYIIQLEQLKTSTIK
ncbi:MAG TPA: hypothetical protein VHB48_05830 [Chitinophagaceae bacterium]|jgi:hypothetical protein|nr:hypothetical protein [Chitinophagaceae bacterium]